MSVLPILIPASPWHGVLLLSVTAHPPIPCQFQQFQPTLEISHWEFHCECKRKSASLQHYKSSNNADHSLRLTFDFDSHFHSVLVRIAVPMALYSSVLFIEAASATCQIDSSSKGDLPIPQMLYGLRKRNSLKEPKNLASNSE